MQMVAVATMTAGVAGASGYAGRELVRLIEGHPALRIGTAQARSDGFEPLNVATLADCDIAFLALPHGESHALAEALGEAGGPVVDLGSDQRLDPAWVYALPELNRARIAGTRRVASPGCYATAALLALAPLAEAGSARLAGRESMASRASRVPAARRPSGRT